MKHIKWFRENYPIKVELESDLRDIFLELQDSGYITEVDVYPQGVNLITIHVYKSTANLFPWSDVGDYFERALEYLSGWGISTYKITILYYWEQVLGVRQRQSFKTVEEFQKFMTEKFLSENKFQAITFSLSKN